MPSLLTQPDIPLTSADGNVTPKTIFAKKFAINFWDMEFEPPLCWLGQGQRAVSL
jgi:hypothetical protein